MYKIILNDGTVIENLELNGNNYISKKILDDSIFENNLSEISIISEEGTEVMTDMKLIQCKQYGTESWFILAQKSSEEKEKEKLQRRINDLEELLLLQGGII